jgi:hypothetical protein
VIFAQRFVHPLSAAKNRASDIGNDDGIRRFAEEQPARAASAGQLEAREFRNEGIEAP